MTTRLRVREFGPIRGGHGDEFIDFKKVTLFCGPQGSGKSTVAKLYSLLSWIEKCVFKDTSLSVSDKLFQQALVWQGIDGYLRTDTEIEYFGACLHFTYAHGKIGVGLVFDDAQYTVPKISYIPAERNFASIVRNASRVEGLPNPLVDMQVEFDKAKKFYGKGYRLPANGFKFQFDQEEPWIVNGSGTDASRTRLQTASSGLQSIVPLLLISEYLETNLEESDDGVRTGVFYDAGSAEKKRKLEEFMESVKTSGQPEQQKRARLDRYFSPSRRFLNIVEEPEQNLYPETQCDVLNRLLALAKRKPLNQLVVSTHSPYVLNHLTLVAQAAEILGRDVGNSELGKRVEKFVPTNAVIGADEMAIYETRPNGEIARLEMVDGLPSDENPLNDFLGRFNVQFAGLLETMG